MSFEYPDALSQPIPDKTEKMATKSDVPDYSTMSDYNSVIKLANARIKQLQLKENGGRNTDIQEAGSLLRGLNIEIPTILAPAIKREDMAKMLPVITPTVDPEKQRNMTVFNELIGRMEGKNSKPYPSIGEVGKTLSAVAGMIKDPENLRKFNDSLSKALGKDIKIAPGSVRFDEGFSFLGLDIVEGGKAVPHTFSLGSKSELVSKGFFPWSKDTYSDPSLSFNLVRLPDRESPKA